MFFFRGVIFLPRNAGASLSPLISLRYTISEKTEAGQLVFFPPTYA